MEIDEVVCLQVLEDFLNDVIVEGLGELDFDDVVYILEDFDEDDQVVILEELFYVDWVQLKKVLDYLEESVGWCMQSEFIVVVLFWIVGQIIDYMCEVWDLFDSFYEIYVVDLIFKLLGFVYLDKILCIKWVEKVIFIMVERFDVVEVMEDQEEVVWWFECYNLVLLVVVDENGCLVGVFIVDDIVDVIQEEVEEDLRVFVGVGDEEIFDSVMMIVCL